MPQLALSWDTSPDGRAVTFKLRPGVKFQDGTDLDASAVAFNLDRDLKLPTSRRRSEIQAIDTIEVVDPLTVTLNLKTPFSPLIAQLSDRAGMIASPKALQNPAGFDTAPACSGPFNSSSARRRTTSPCSAIQPTGTTTISTSIGSSSTS